MRAHNCSQQAFQPREERGGPAQALCVGFIWRNRGIESVLEACAGAVRNGAAVRIVFAGEIVDKPYHNELHDYATSLGLTSESLVFTDKLDPESMSQIMYESDSRYCRIRRACPAVEVDSQAVWLTTWQLSQPTTRQTVPRN